MFAGGRRRSSNVRAMQLFHELKQQFPTVPDHIVSACIANNAHQSREALEATLNNHQEPMGRAPSSEAPSPPNEMNDSCDSDLNQNVVKQSGAFYSRKTDRVDVNPRDDDLPERVVGNSSFYAKRPTHLDIGSDSKRKEPFEFSDAQKRIQPSKGCTDVHKLLNSDNVNEKPPRSPLSVKRLSKPKNSPITPPESTKKGLCTPKTPSPLSETPPKRETVETPTQTTDTLVGGGGSVNLSLNVNCTMDVVQSPTTHQRRSSVLQLVPQQPWMVESVPPRSYTHVNLTLRPPTSQPQAPIDITSQNSSLTYSTSTFDKQKGLQSRLQITVGPCGGSVASVRTRPKSSYLPEPDGQDAVPVRAGSLPDLANSNEAPVVIKQQARIERLKIELNMEKAQLIVMQREIAELQNNQNSAAKRTDEELEKQLLKEIQHLRCQCERLQGESNSLPEWSVDQVDVNEDFYGTIYTGQRGPITMNTPMGLPTRGRLQYQGPLSLPQPEPEGPKWNCHLCTFQNHPLLNKCEQCDMPRILHGTNPPGPNPNVAFNMVRPVGHNGPFMPNAVFNHNNTPARLLDNGMRVVPRPPMGYPPVGIRQNSPSPANPMFNRNGFMGRNQGFTSNVDSRGFNPGPVSHI